MEHQGQGQQRPKIEWKRDKAFTDPRSGVTVAVSKSSGHVPMYSFQIGRMREDGSVSTNSQWRTRRNQATFELENDYASLIARKTISNIIQESAVDFVNDFEVTWQKYFEPFNRPFLQCFRQQRMVRIR